MKLFKKKLLKKNQISPLLTFIQKEKVHIKIIYYTFPQKNIYYTS